MAKNVMTQLIEHGQVHRGMIGVTIQPVTSDIASSLGLAQVRGALVNSVEAGSPADKAGVRRGDVITAVNGESIGTCNDLRNEVVAAAAGDRDQAVDRPRRQGADRQPDGRRAEARHGRTERVARARPIPPGSA